MHALASTAQTLTRPASFRTKRIIPFWAVIVVLDGAVTRTRCPRKVQVWPGPRAVDKFPRVATRGGRMRSATHSDEEHAPKHTTTDELQLQHEA